MVCRSRRYIRRRSIRCWSIRHWSIRRWSRLIWLWFMIRFGRRVWSWGIGSYWNGRVSATDSCSYSTKVSKLRKSFVSLVFFIFNLDSFKRFFFFIYLRTNTEVIKVSKVTKISL